MRKNLILFLLMLPVLSFADNPPRIILSREASHETEPQRSETSNHFSAEIVSNTIIRVFSEKNTTFNVKILDASLSTILYQGVTVDGVFHITDGNLSAGHFVLSIVDHGVVYNGEFEILSN